MTPAMCELVEAVKRIPRVCGCLQCHAMIWKPIDTAIAAVEAEQPGPVEPVRLNGPFAGVPFGGQLPADAANHLLAAKWLNGKYHAPEACICPACELARAVLKGKE